MKIYLFLMTAAIFLLLATPTLVSAQADKESELGLSNILRLGGIDREIELTAQQQDELFGLWLEIKFDFQKAFQSFRDNFSETLPASRQLELKQELDDAIAKIRNKEVERLEKTLLPKQIERLKQLRIQYLNRIAGAGIGSLREELDLTSAQLVKIEQASASLKKKLLEIQSRQREEKLTKSEIVAIGKELRDESRNQVMAVLTAPQQRKLKRLQGKVFDFATGRLAGDQGNEAQAEKENESTDSQQQKTGVTEKDKQGK